MFGAKEIFFALELLFHSSEDLSGVISIWLKQWWSKYIDQVLE